MIIFYNLGIFFLGLGIRFAALRSQKAQSFVAGRRDWKKNMKASISQNRTRVWVHVASLGEYDQALPVIEKLHSLNQDFDFVVTFFSPSGFEHAKLPSFISNKFYLPFDTRRNAREFVDILDPQLVIFVKYDIWYHYLHEVKSRNIHLILISSLFRADQIYFKTYGRLMRDALQCFNTIFVQNKLSQDLLNQIAIPSIISGDTRYERVHKRKVAVETFPEIASFSNSKSLLIFGSCWKDDLEQVLPYCNENDHFKYIFAPHKIDQSTLEFIENNFVGHTIRYSKIDGDLSEYSALIIDNIGMLASLYAIGQVAYVGGAFHGSLHNILEPAVFGLPIIFGPNHKKFPEANAMLEAGCAMQIENQQDFKDHMMLLSNESDMSRVGNIAAKFVEGQLGAVDIIMEKLKSQGLEI